MRRTARRAAALVVAFGLSPGAAGAGVVGPSESGAGWRVEANNELRFDHYDITGDRAQSAYRNDGSFLGDTLGVAIQGNVGRTLRVRLESGVYAGSDDYRAHDGFVLERLRLRIEDARATMPLRLEIGDVDADVSRRTLRRLVRGGRFEIQPRSAHVAHSLLGFFGSGVPDWRNVLNGDGLHFGGLSWLVADPAGRWSIQASGLRSQRFPGTLGLAVPTTTRTTQWLAGVLGEAHALGLVAEGEVDWLRDKPDGGARTDDASFYAQLAREAGPWRFRLRHDQAGSAFAPAGNAQFRANYRVSEAEASTEPSPHLRLAVRYQHIEDGWDGAGPEIDTNTFGAAADTHPLASRRSLHLRAGFDRNRIEGTASGIDQTFDTLLAAIADRLGDRLGWSYELRRGRLADAVGPGSSRYTDHGGWLDFALGRGREVTLRAGVVHRQQRRSGAFAQWMPVCDVAGVFGRHRLRAHFDLVHQDFEGPSAFDLRYYSMALDYGMTLAGHELFVSLDQALRRPEGALRTDTRRLTVGVRQRVSFGLGR